MLRFLPLFPIVIALAGCGGSSPPPAPPVWRGAVPGPWAITQGSFPGPVAASCAAGTPVTVRLLLHRAGDNMSGLGAYAFYRWFSVPHSLTAGVNTIAVPIGDISQWIPVYASDAASEEQGYIGTLQQLGSVGVCFGGGDFACHGVSGSGHFQINGATVQ